MKKTALIAGLIVSGTILGAATPAFADADGNLPYVSNGQIEFTENTDGNKPKDPDDKKTDVVPGPGPYEPGTKTSLSIDFVSNLDFGKQKITTDDQTYKSKLQFLEEKDASGTVTDSYYTSNFAQVTDNRGEATPSGWTLTVKQLDQFKTGTPDPTTHVYPADAKELTGAAITFKNTKASSLSNADSDYSNYPADLKLVPGTEVNVASALAGKGAGMTQVQWGPSAHQAVPSGTPATDDPYAGVPTSDNITLFVPGATNKVKDVYTTKLSWNLKNVPTNITGA